jgi:hypothetical protein
VIAIALVCDLVIVVVVVFVFTFSLRGLGGDFDLRHYAVYVIVFFSLFHYAV